MEKYDTNKELVEMYKKGMEYKKGKEVAKLKVERTKGVAFGIASTFAASFCGVRSYHRLFTEQNIGLAILLGVGCACWAFNTYRFFRRAYEADKKVKGLEKEVAELEKE